VFFTRETFSQGPVLILLALILTAMMPLAHAAAIQGTQALNVGPAPWDSAHLFRPWVIYDGTSFTMWYGGEDSQGADRIGMATSNDGISWTKYSGNPVLDPGTPGTWDGDAISDASVIKENGQYKMWYTGQTYGATSVDDVFRIGYATSPDGIHWTRYSENPVLTPGSLGSWDDRRVWRPSVISTGSGYVMYYRGAAVAEGSQAKAGVATSSDGIHWTKTVVLTMPAGSSGWDAYSRQVDALNIGGVMRSDNTYIMSYVSIKSRNSPAQIGLASSSDGISWTPYADNPVVTYGTSGGWDSGAGGVGAGNFAGSMILAARNQYYVYYGAQDPSGTYSIGVATLPSSIYPISQTTTTVSSSTVSSGTVSNMVSTTFSATSETSATQQATATTIPASQPFLLGSSLPSLIIGRMSQATLLMVTLGAIFAVTRIASKKKLKTRGIPGIERLDKWIQQAGELDRPVLFTPGTGTIQTPDTLAALALLDHVASRCAQFGVRLIVANADFNVHQVTVDMVRNAYKKAGREDLYTEDTVRYISVRQFAYAAGVMGLLRREKPALNVFVGDFQAEALEIAEAGRADAIAQFGGTSNVDQLPFFMATCDQTLVGEELYTAQGYLTDDPQAISRLVGPDAGKAIAILLIAIGAILVTLGNHVLTSLLRL
jgi:predicted GH43/DUF377 family glycosyl hydrolase